MLKKLLIKNFAIIDALEVEFSDHLNIITGETGAGKSIIVGALSLLLGQKINSKTNFNESDKCIIEGLFTISDYHLKEVFEELELEYADETILRREISSQAKSRVFINDSPSNLQALQILGNHLIDIHSQHETLDINQESFQMQVLDGIAGQNSLFGQFQKSMKEFKKKERHFKEQNDLFEKSKQEMDFLEFQIHELKQAKFNDPQEQNFLEAELLELTHAEEIKTSIFQSLQLFNGEKEAVLYQLKLAGQYLQNITKYLPQLEPLIERIKASQIEIKDLSGELEDMDEGIQINSSRLDWVQSRLNQMYTLEQKHRVSDLPGLLNFHKDLENRLITINQNDEHLHQLELEILSDKALLHQLAESLNQGRNRILKNVILELNSSLKEMGIVGGDFTIDLTSNPKEFTPYGYDRIQFLFSANKGFAPMPLSKVASGGELSRLVLAIKTLSSKYLSLPTLLFDEIDTGVSGEIALKLGKVMQNLSIHNQVIAITHLPQIASRNGRHFKVYKETQKNQDRTKMVVLEKESRIEEIAKMLSGNDPSEFALKNAHELIAN